MKKIKIFVVIIICFLVVGCGNKTVIKTCSINSDQSANGYKSSTKYKIYSNDNVVYKVEQSEVIESDKKEILDFYKKEYNSIYKKYNKTYGGYTYSVDIDKNKLKLSVITLYKNFDMDKYLKGNKDIKKYVNKDNYFTLDGIIKMYENIGCSCK